MTNNNLNMELPLTSEIYWKACNPSTIEAYVYGREIGHVSKLFSGQWTAWLKLSGRSLIGKRFYSLEQAQEALSSTWNIR